jgi:hypothetical protein
MRIPPAAGISDIFMEFTRHERRYYVFSVNDSPFTFLYFTHLRERSLRALFYGEDFLPAIRTLWKNEQICIECGLGTRIKGGVSLDRDELVASGFSTEEANKLIEQLKEMRPGDHNFFLCFPAGS